MARQEGVVGVYLPFWTYDSHTTSHYTGQRGTHYYTTETYRDGNETRTRQVRHTRWQSASGTVALFHDDVLVPATRAVSESRLRSLAPWDFERLAAYDPAYLAGYEAQRYQLDMAGGFERAKELMAGTIDSSIRHDIGGDEQQVDSVSTSYSGVSFKHLLLPVYLGAYSFKQKIYQIMVNARSGQVQGDRPYSLWKIAGAVLLALVVFFVVYQVAK
jgi:hypothetical protein